MNKNWPLLLCGLAVRLALPNDAVDISLAPQRHYFSLFIMFATLCIWTGDTAEHLNAATNVPARAKYGNEPTQKLLCYCAGSPFQHQHCYSFIHYVELKRIKSNAKNTRLLLHFIFDPQMHPAYAYDDTEPWSALEQFAIQQCCIKHSQTYQMHINV